MKFRFALLLIVMLFAAPVGVPSPGPTPAQPTPAGQETYEEELREFVPSEEVNADTAIAFPVDI